VNLEDEEQITSEKIAKKMQKQYENLRDVYDKLYISDKEELFDDDDNDSQDDTNVASVRKLKLVRFLACLENT
jgi:hypothetical protein